MNEPHQKHAIHRQQWQQHVEESAISIHPTVCRTHTRPIGTQSGVGRQSKQKKKQSINHVTYESW